MEDPKESGSVQAPAQEPAVLPPKSSAALYQMLLNIFIPGLGALIYTRFALFVPCLLLLGIAVAMIVLLDAWWKMLAIAVFILWWLVSAAGGIYYYLKDPWTRGS